MKNSINVAALWILLSLQVETSNAFVRPAATSTNHRVKLDYVSPPQDADTVHIDRAFPVKVSSPRFPPKEAHPIQTPTISKRKELSRIKWGVDKDYDEEYWFNSKIHTLGNTGFTGGLHAAMAPLATKVIDVLAYDGVDIRSAVAEELAKTLKVSKARILDLCCGVGMSTRALRNAFPEAKEVIGIDTSPEMVSMAQAISVHNFHVMPLANSVKALLNDIDQILHRQSLKMKKAQNEAVACLSQATFFCGNAEHTLFPAKSFDLVTIMYAFHEVPKKGRDCILREAHRLLHSGGMLALIDISPDYEPSPSMLKGEPYVQEYQGSIDRQLRMMPGFTGSVSKQLVPGHVNMWLLKRS